MASVMTPLWVVTNSTISCRAARFTSFHFRSDRGSATKSNRTQHCRIFCTNSSSRSFDVASAARNSENITACGNYATLHYTTVQTVYSYGKQFTVNWPLLTPSSEHYIYPLCWNSVTGSIGVTVCTTTYQPNTHSSADGNTNTANY